MRHLIIMGHDHYVVDEDRVGEVVQTLSRLIRVVIENRLYVEDTQHVIIVSRIHDSKVLLKGGPVEISD